MEDEDFNLFIAYFKRKTAIDLAQYKEVQMKRRLTTLRQRRGFASFAEYSKALNDDPSLLIELLDRMTINVSEFYRNPARWEMLEKRFLPELLQQQTRLKIWSAACSTGEEPYTLAMILSELGALQHSELLATDLDLSVLIKAKEGVYVERSLRDVPASCKKRYFKEQDRHFFVDERLKKAIHFKQHNLLNDPFDTDFDLIVCRNVMIYFKEEAKKQLYAKFAEALRPGGLLFVGSTEQIFSPAQFALETADTFFYRKAAISV